MDWFRITIFVIVSTTLTKTVTANVGICPSNTTAVNITQLSGNWYYVRGNNVGPELKCIKVSIKEVDPKMQMTKTGLLLSNNKLFNATETLTNTGGGWFLLRVSETGSKYSLNILGTDYQSYLVIAHCTGSGNKDEHAVAIAAVVATRSSKPSKGTLDKAREILHKYKISNDHFIDYDQETCTNDFKLVNAVNSIKAALRAATPTNVVHAVNATNVIRAVNTTATIHLVNATNTVHPVNETNAVHAVNATNLVHAVNATNLVHAVNATNLVNAVNATSSLHGVNATSLDHALNATNAVHAVHPVHAVNVTNSVPAVNITKKAN